MRLLLYLIAGCCLLAARPARAQADSLRPAAPAATPASLPARPAAAAAGPDTVAALHHLFARYRGRRWRVAVGTLLVGGGLTTTLAVSANHANDGLAAGLEVLGAVLLGAPTAVLVSVDFVALGRVSRRRERLAIEQWRAHQLLAEVRKALRSKDFATPTR